jgi:hypothetical protein
MGVEGIFLGGGYCFVIAYLIRNEKVTKTSHFE